MSLAGWLNTAWMGKCAGEAWAFRRATRRVAQTQAVLLRSLVRANQHTDFGRAHGFDRLRQPRDFQEQVPLSCSEDYTGAIARIAAGEANVLTRQRVLLLEPTSGTTGGEKWIPYTAGLRRQFQRGVAAWIFDLFRHRPALRRGRAYWSISPAFGAPRRTAGGLPIGFEDDTAYLGALERWALDRLLVVPPAVARLPNLESFRYVTLGCLLQAEDLALVSIWNPTFLTALLAPLEDWHDRLCFDLRRGLFQPPAPVPAELEQFANGCSGEGEAPAEPLASPARQEPRPPEHGRYSRPQTALVQPLTAGRRPDSRRAQTLAGIFRSASSWADKLRRIWPRLSLISCWADAAAASSVEELRRLFPAVEIQPKGLLATEGCVSIPLTGRPGAALALRCHFFEFQEVPVGSWHEPGKERCRLGHELERGGRYRVVLTTAGGLYRYQLRDEVEVVGYENDCPLLRFLGKADRVSDRVGEKLAEPHVRAVLEWLFAVHGLAPRFALLVPVEGRPAHYRLYLQDPAVQDRPGLVSALTADLEAGLQENPHYRYALGLGQLGPVEVQPLDPQAESGWQIYERRCLGRGQKVGTIKPAVLDTGTGWPDLFQGLLPAPVPAQGV